MSLETTDPNETPNPACPPDDPDCPDLELLLEQLATSSAKGNFDKTARDKLIEVAKGRDKALQEYKRERPGIKTRWQNQDGKLDAIEKHLKQCYPTWEDHLKNHVCGCDPKNDPGVIYPLYKVRTKLREKLGSCETALDDAKVCAKDAELQLESWKDMSNKLKARLDKNQALYEEICKLDKCEDHGFALYIYFFELLPWHEHLAPPDSKKCSHDRQRPANGPKDPEDDFCKMKLGPTCKLEGYPWLLEIEDYEDKLTKVACAWRDAGRVLADAQAAFDQIAELRKRFEEDNKPEVKRLKAKEALKALNESNAKGSGRS